MELNEKMLQISLGMSVEQLQELTKIEIRVDTTNTHMQYVGEVLQSLQILRLNDSVIPSARDLGTSFKSLQVLSINRCEMKSLAGLSSLEFLKELYANYNDIEDLFDVSYWYHLEILDLEGNKVSTWDNISYLMNWHKLHDLNLSMNPISSEQNYQNRVKETLRHLKFIDDLHVGVISPFEVRPTSPDLKDNFSLAKEKNYVLSKFANFDFLKFEEINKLADDAIEMIDKEDSEEVIIMKQVKRHERKNEAFEKETFDIFDDWNESEPDSEQEDAKDTDTKKRMWRSCTNGFVKRKDSDVLSENNIENRSTAYDDSDSVFRSSLKGFFTGRKKIESHTIYDSSSSTRETNEYSSLVSNNDRAFSGNPLKALKHNRKNMFSNYGGSDIVEAKGIEQLINDFTSTASDFKKSMGSWDFAERLKRNQQADKMNDYYSKIENPTKLKTNSISKESIKFVGSWKRERKFGPIKAERIALKSQNSNS